MIEISHTMTDPMGLHAALAAKVVRTLRPWSSTVVASRGAQSAPGTDILGLMALDVREGDLLTFVIEGDDEGDAAQALEELLAQA